MNLTQNFGLYIGISIYDRIISYLSQRIIIMGMHVLNHVPSASIILVIVRDHGAIHMTKYYYLFRSKATLFQRLYYIVNVYYRIYRIEGQIYMND